VEKNRTVKERQEGVRGRDVALYKKKKRKDQKHLEDRDQLITQQLLPL